jgi:hypothetical protein
VPAVFAAALGITQLNDTVTIEPFCIVICRLLRFTLVLLRFYCTRSTLTRQYSILILKYRVSLLDTLEFYCVLLNTTKYYSTVTPCLLSTYIGIYWTAPFKRNFSRGILSIT